MVRNASSGEPVAPELDGGLDPAERIIQSALAARPDAKPFASPTMSDWVWLSGIPTVKVGPGDSRRPHTPDEYVTVRELEEGADFYERLIRAYFA